MDPQIRVGIDVGCKAHRVGISDLNGSILEEFDVSHTDAGFCCFRVKSCITTATSD